MYGRTFLRVRYLEKRERSLSSAEKEHADWNKQGGQWYLHSSATDHRGVQLSSREAPTALIVVPSLFHVLRPSPGTFCRFDPFFPRMDDVAWKERDRAELAYGGRCTREHTRHYKHRTIERNGRSDCFVLSSASLAGRSGRRVTWTSTATTRSGPAGSTSSRLSAICYVSSCSI